MTITRYMQRIFFRNRRYTTFNKTYLIHSGGPEEHEQIANEMKEEEYQGWTPCVSFTIWVKYIKVSNDEAQTELKVIKLI